MAENDYVENDEELYRNVRRNWKPPHYTCKDGRLVIEYHAFWDSSPSKAPSVDRAKLLDCNPRRALLNKTNGIVSIRTSDVRAITDVITENDDKPITHDIDVEPAHTDDRPAHAQITVDPDYLESKREREKTFKRLQRALARLANKFITEHGWTLPVPK